MGPHQGTGGERVIGGRHGRQQSEGRRDRSDEETGPSILGSQDEEDRAGEGEHHRAETDQGDRELLANDLHHGHHRKEEVLQEGGGGGVGKIDGVEVGQGRDQEPEEGEEHKTSGAVPGEPGPQDEGQDPSGRERPQGDQGDHGETEALEEGLRGGSRESPQRSREERFHLRSAATIHGGPLGAGALPCRV